MTNNRHLQAVSTTLLRRRLARRAARRATDTELIELAKQPVPPRSGVVSFGEGPYTYIKSRPDDGSMRVFQFATSAAAHCAMQAAVIAEVADLFAASDEPFGDADLDDHDEAA
ncbi:MAG: hypothetical protein KF901_03330 [Myxococcales bacterium]|nr:hypothetical protein [Myxococcales bacterium]